MRKAPVPAWLAANIKDDTAEGSARDHAIFDRLRHTQQLGGADGQWSRVVRRTVYPSDEDFWIRHTNQGSYARYYEDAARAWEWRPLEGASAIAVSYSRESFASEQLEIKGDDTSGMMATMRGNVLVGLAFVEWP